MCVCVCSAGAFACKVPPHNSCIYVCVCVHRVKHRSTVCIMYRMNTHTHIGPFIHRRCVLVCVCAAFALCRVEKKIMIYIDLVRRERGASVLEARSTRVSDIYLGQSCGGVCASVCVCVCTRNVPITDIFRQQDL